MKKLGASFLAIAQPGLFYFLGASGNSNFMKKKPNSIGLCACFVFEKTVSGGALLKFLSGLTLA